MADLTYMKSGNYQIPDLILDGEDEMEMKPLGKYGMMRQDFLKKHHHGTYTSMLLTGRLMPHLYQTDQQAQEQVEQTVLRMMKQNGIDETLKEHDQITWIQSVNSYIAQAEEIVLQEIVYR